MVKTFGEFVIQGNVVVGLVIFLIIVLVQFIVITKGAERVAEVAARYLAPARAAALAGGLCTGSR